MQHRLLVLALTLIIFASPALAQWNLQQRAGTLASPLEVMDVFNDTIKYDDGLIYWWYNGLTNFRLATKFTPAANYRLQRILVAMDSSSTSPLFINVKNDSAGFPGGTPIWSGNLFYSVPRTWRGVTVDTTNLPQYLFTAGSNFWVEVLSLGPPFEIYDITPVSPSRSKTFYAPWGGWVDSPGDNFIRVAGQYTTSVVDAACDSIWHGGNFFLQNPGTLPISARVKNLGTATATFTVACSLFTELGNGAYSFYQALTPQTVTSLSPGGNTTVTFPSANLSVSNRYRIRARTLLSGDLNADNNAKDTETQIYTLPAALRYDDSTYANAAYALTGNGWAMKFNPHQPGSYSITQVRVMAQYAPGDSAARVQILDDNGAGGAPGTVLYETVQTMATGWNTINTSLANQTGSFYVAYIFQSGTHTSALRYGNYPNSGQGWAKSGATWAADPSVSDWMIRASISSGATPPALDVALTPINPPITVPAAGGSFNFNATVQRVQAPQAPFYVWSRDRFPDGSYTANLLGPVQINPPVGQQVTRLRTQNVPGTWPAGIHWYIGYANPTVAYPAADADSFAWTKLTTGAEGPFVWDAACTGELFEGETVPQQAVGHLAAFSLVSASPNPFNPTTTIRYQLQAASQVKLTVWDTAGRLVYTLVNGWQEAGQHNVTFDGSKLASGMYFMKMQAGSLTAVQKLMLLK